MKRYAIIGYPLEHSYSPAMHNTAFRHYGMEAKYEARPLVPDKFEEGLNRLRKEGIRGFNITIPYKQRILPFLQKLDPLAEKIGAVNTVVCTPEGSWTGYNTDAYGFILPIRERIKDIRDILILGAGGAARAVAFSLVTEAHPRRLTLMNRTLSRANDLRQALEPFASVPIQCIDASSGVYENYDLIVNTTSVGMGALAGETPLADLASCSHSGTIVYDLIYNPACSRLLKEASVLHLKTVNGLPMLIGQGSRAFYLWTGRYFPQEVDNIFSNT